MKNWECKSYERKNIRSTVNAKEFVEDPSEAVLVQILLELPHVHVVASDAVLEYTNLLETLKLPPAKNFLFVFRFTLFLHS